MDSRGESKQVKDNAPVLGLNQHQIKFNDHNTFLASRNKELDECISELRKSMFTTPLDTSGIETKLDGYPMKDFKVEEVTDVENDYNYCRFFAKQTEFSDKKKSTTVEWLFHASNSVDASYSISQVGFLKEKIGSNSGNAGAYGKGIYFSPRGHHPMLLARNHSTLIACKVMRGNTKKVPELLDKNKPMEGVAIAESFDSHTSIDDREVVIREAEQALPSFLIKFSIPELKDKNTEEVKKFYERASRFR